MPDPSRKWEEVEEDFFDIYVDSLSKGYRIDSLYADSTRFLWLGSSDFYEETGWVEGKERGELFGIPIHEVDPVLEVEEHYQMGVREYTPVCKRCSTEPFHCSDGTLYCPLCNKDVGDRDPLAIRDSGDGEIEEDHRVFGVTFAGVDKPSFANTHPTDEPMDVILYILSVMPAVGFLFITLNAGFGLVNKDYNEYGIAESSWRNAVMAFPFYLLSTYLLFIVS